MADELDPTLEARLREALRAEADALPFAVRGADLRRVAAERARARRSQRFGLMAAAAALVVVLGGAAILATVRPQGDVAASPSASAGASPSAGAGASPSASMADRPLATYEELEAHLLGFGPPDPLLPALRGEHPTADSGDVPLTTTLGTINGARVSVDCIGGTITVGVGSPGGSVQSQDQDCRDEPFSMGIGEIGELFVTALPSVRWRIVAGDIGATEEIASAPPAGDLQPGETRLVRMDVQAGDPAKEQTATIPAGTDVLYLTAPCNGEGALEIEIDGVAASYTCGAIGIETFTPDFDDQLLVRASATGTAAFAVRVGAVDWEAARPDAWRPPALRLSGPDRTAGDIVTLAAYPGCGWSWEPKGGGGFSTDCGPSWQPMGAALWQRPATMVILHLGGGWTITDVTVEIARNEDILATGRAPGSQPWTVRAMGDEPFVLDVPEPGDWGVRLLVSGERNGDRFQVPYYARIVVEAP